MGQSEIRMPFGLTPDEPLPDLGAMPADMMRKLGEYVAAPGTFFDACPVDAVTKSSIRRLRELLPQANLDIRRFRANLVLDDGMDEAAAVERDWVGGRLRTGRNARLAVMMECPRCTMFAAAQPGIAKDSTITRTLVREMRQMMSVYCDVVRGGAVATGDGGRHRTRWPARRRLNAARSDGDQSSAETNADRRCFCSRSIAGDKGSAPVSLPISGAAQK